MAYNARPNRPDKYITGKYTLINESKYISNPNSIIYRSSLELKMCKYLDKNPKVKKWGSEVISIPYRYFNLKTGKYEDHTYHTDFFMEIETDDITGMERYIIEVKPHDEYIKVVNNEPPAKPKKKTPKSLRNWEYALTMFIINKHKWIAAKEFARRRNMKFVIITEKLINKLFK